MKIYWKNENKKVDIDMASVFNALAFKDNSVSQELKLLFLGWLPTIEQITCDVNFNNQWMIITFYNTKDALKIYNSGIENILYCIK